MTRPRSRNPASCLRGGFSEFLEAAAARRDDEAGRRGKRDAAAADIQDSSAEVGSQRIGVDVHFAGRRGAHRGRHREGGHLADGKPFCHVDLRVDNALYEQAPERYSSEIVIRVLKDMGTPLGSARQRVTISYADFEIAQALEIKVNSPVFRVFREFFDRGGRLIYSANLIYPGDVLEFEMEFTVDTAD